MYIRLSKAPSNKDYLVYLVESYRDEQKRTKQRIIKSFGKLGDLTKDDPEALDKLKQWAKEETERRKKEKSVNFALDLSEAQDGEQKPRNYGYVVLEHFYNTLGITEVLKKHQRTKRIDYDLDKILRLLVFSRALSPASKKRTYLDRGNFFLDLDDFPMSAVYKSLDHLGALKDTLTKRMHEGITDNYGRDCTLVYYDVTNYYFESDIYEGLRQKGVSKEKKKTGIVQMGLFIDSSGVPITYELFPGNTNDFSTMRPILEKVKRDYNIKSITIVADKGNNSASNMGYIDRQGDHYIVSQRIRYRGNKLADIVLDEAGYKSTKKGFKFKTVKRVRKVEGRTITENLICVYSQKEADYQKRKRGVLEDVLQKFLDDPSLLKSSNTFGMKKYIQTEEMDTTTGEIKHTKTVATFDKEKYERDTALDGYYALVTNDLSLSAFEVVKAYKGLYRIEESFRVTKSDLEGRPVYVWNDAHIRGHFLTCYIALTLYRLLQVKMDQQYSVKTLQEALKSAQAVKLEKDIYLLHTTTDVFRAINRLFTQTLDYKRMRLEDLRSTLRAIARP